MVRCVEDTKIKDNECCHCNKYLSTRKQTCIHDLGFENTWLNGLISQGTWTFQEAQNRAQWLLYLPVT